ncbi:MAG: Lrp/AsnC ligand binding domain-containing protein [Candidatus Poseidoniaceae archaeon]|nr:Lrp/AsnC ligand binding domain-containing protein [Candidatus Poseidoniaceae archaeon]
MATGFVLITTKPGKEHDVRARLDEIEEVTNRWMLFGEYDLIAKVESEEEYVLTRVIVEDIRPRPGITDTKTLLGAEL